MKHKVLYNSVMLVDDNELDNLINEKMIESVGIANSVYVFSAGRSAIEFLRAIEKSQHADLVLPEVIFLDIDMPMMDGFQFLEHFESLTALTQSKCKVVILTSSVNIRDSRRMKRIKFVKGYLNKPLTGTRLTDMDQLFNVTQAEQQSVEESTDQAG